MNKQTIEILHQLDDILNDAIDKLIAIRVASKGTENFYHNRYITKKVESALNNIKMAEEKYQQGSLK
jgi:hypothetical protein